MNLRRVKWVLIAIATSWSLQLHAQWVTQTIKLNPGWNSIYLEVQPEPRSCDAIFAHVPVVSVWGWNRKFSPVQFIQNANELLAPNPDWLVYTASNNPIYGQNTLYGLEGGKAYLVLTSTNGGTNTITLTGKPTLRKAAWLGNSFNLVGFPVTTNNPPTFQSFFKSSPAHAGNEVYRLNSFGAWVPTSPTVANMRSGEAFWVYTTGESTYAGPLDLVLEQSTGVDYGSTLTEQTINVTNRSTNAQSVVVKVLSSVSPPNSTQPALAGPVSLSYWNMNLASNQYWTALSGPLTNTLGSNATWSLRLAVNRTNMPPYNGSVGSAGALYQNILEFSDPAGTFHFRLPVTSQANQTQASQFGTSHVLTRGPATKDATPSALLGGLWVGAATVSNVSQPSNLSDQTTAFATPSPFQMRLIFHVDAIGKGHLLQRVFQMWSPGTTNADGSVAQPGHYVLVSNEKYISSFAGSTISDGTAVGQRFSSAAFGYDNAISNVIDSTFGTNLWSCQVTTGFDDPTNPFKHLYHPDHNNKDENGNPYPQGIESFTVQRTIQLQFTTSDPDGLVASGWNTTELGGLYSESITGLHRSVINVSGSFRLRQVSAINVLNDGLTN